MILAIDGTNWLHQLWHAQGAHGALATFLRRIEAISEHLKPAHVVVCFDRRSFRADLFPAYKAKRPDKEPELCALLAEAEAAVTGYATILAQDGFEADDGLASLAVRGRQIGAQVVLASPDKDVRQCLVAGEVTILRGFRLDNGKPADFDYLTAAHLKEKCGLTPEQWPSYQALCGDSGDGIPGCPGWGDVTTRAALAIAGTLDGCLANPWTLPITAKQRVALSKFPAALMLQLVTLRTDLEAAWDVLR